MGKRALAKMELKDLFSKVHVGYCWLFITEKCNLDCEYCFYKERDLASTVSFNEIKKIIDALPNNKPPEFVFSGGEPTLEFNLIKETVKLIKEKYPRPYILIQTNGILLDDNKLAYIKDNNINLEFGIDGQMITTLNHRLLTTQGNYQRTITIIKKSIKENIGVSCTMTVHPHEAIKMIENFEYLLSLGIKKIEITPAVFEKWDQKSKEDYLNKYETIVHIMKNRRQEKILSTVYDRPLQSPQLDVILTGTGMILPSWASLSFPRQVKEKYAYYVDGKIKTKVLSKYLIMHNKFYKKKNSTYRELSTLHAGLVDIELRYKSKKTSGFQQYVDINHAIKGINQQQLLVP